MICMNCRKPIDYPLEKEHHDYLSNFITEDQHIVFKSSNDIYINDNRIILASAIFTASINNPGLLATMRKLEFQNTKFTTVCKECNKESSEFLYNYYLNNLYLELKLIQRKYIYDSITRITHIKESNLHELLNKNNGTMDEILMAIKVIKKIDYDLYNKMITTNEIIESFHYSERGGDGDNEIITYLYNLVSSDVIPSLIADFIKYNSWLLFVLIKRKFFSRNKTLYKQATTEVDEYLKYENVKNVLKLLKPKDRKKLTKKVVKAIIKEKEGDFIKYLKDV